MKRKMLTLSLMLAMAASAFSLTVMAQTAENLPVATSENVVASENLDAPQAGEIAINQTNFPDQGFYEYVVSKDTDKNGALSAAEIGEVRTMYLSGDKITSLKGIEYFTELQRLDMNNTQVTELDLSACKKLMVLRLDRNLQLNQLNVTGCTALTTLIATNGGLSGLDVSANTALEFLNVSDNCLTELNLDSNTALTTLYAYRNQLAKLDVSANPVLKELNASANQLTELDASANAALTSLDVYDNLLTKLNVTGCTALTTLHASNNQLTALDVSSCSALMSLDVYNNQLRTLNVSGCTALAELQANYNQLTTLAVNGFSALTVLKAEENELTSLDVSGCASLTLLHAFNNPLTELDVSGCTALAELEVYSSQLTKLNLAGCTALDTLLVSGNQLTQLDVSGNTALRVLDVSGNVLTQLNVNSNAALEELNLGGNQLTSLDVSKNTTLTSLNVSGNQLTELDTSANTALTALSAEENSLAAVVTGSQLSTFSVSNPCRLAFKETTGQGVDLKAYSPIFDASRVSELKGAKIDESGVLTEWVSGSSISYTYDAGFGQSLNVIVTVTDENAKGLSFEVQPVVKTYDGVAVTEQQIIVGAKAAYDGKEIAGTWRVDNLPELKNVGIYRVTLVFTPDSNEYLSGTAETVVQVNRAPLTLFPYLTSNRIGLSDPVPDVSLGIDGAVNGETVKPAIEAVFTGIPQQGVRGYHTIKISNAQELAADIQSQEISKNYDIQVESSCLHITNAIILSSPESPVLGTVGRLDYEPDFANVPEILKAAGFDTVEKITEILLASKQGATSENTVVYDVHYNISTDGKHWSQLTAQQFPKDGMTITLPYPEGVDPASNEFTAMHMFTQNMNGYHVGDVEVLKTVKVTNGLQMTVNGFSPIAITWEKTGAASDGGSNTTPPPSGGNETNIAPNGGGNVTTAPDTRPIVQTGDNTALVIYAVIMTVSAAGVMYLLMKTKNGKQKQQ